MERLLTLYSEVQSTDVRWLWYPFIAIGKITLLQGDPGDGKSTMMMNLIAELSTGGKTPDGCKIGVPQKVIYQCSEDGVSDTIKPRLERCGADCRKIAFINEEFYNGLTLDDERIRQAIIEFRPRLVVIDPIQAYLGSDSDLQIAGRARKLMRRLGMWAAGYDCAIVLIGHLNKKESSKGLYRSLGSIDVVAAARSVLQVERDTENPDIRIVHQIKNSLAPTAEDIRFSISADKGFRWLECRPQLFEKQQPDAEPKFDTEQQKAAYWIKVTKNNGNRCSAYVPEHHEAIVSPEIARAAHLVASSKKKCGVQDIVVIQQGALKGFVGIHPNWSGINAESIRSLCLNAYLPEEVVELNDMTEMRSGKKSDMALLSDYLTVSGTCFINQSSPVITISKNGIRFSKACHTRLDDCEHVELLYHPILQVVILRKSNRDASTAIHWENKDKICSSFSSRAFSGVIFEAMNWKWSCRYQCRGICRGEENARFLIFELDESRILIGKNQYEQIEGRSMDLKCRLYRSKWIQSIAASDVMKSGQVVENPMIGAIPSRNEVQRELDDLLMSM